MWRVLYRESYAYPSVRLSVKVASLRPRPHSRGDVGPPHSRGDVGPPHSRGDVGPPHSRDDVGPSIAI